MEKMLCMSDYPEFDEPQAHVDCLEEALNDDVKFYNSHGRIDFSQVLENIREFNKGQW